MKYHLNCDSILEYRYLSRIEPFQHILNVLVRFDERHLTDDRHCHYMRRAVAMAPANDLTIVLGRIEDGVYCVFVNLDSRLGYLRTSYIHEDDIYIERQIEADNDDHPVHQLLCLTDLFVKSRPITKPEFLALQLSFDYRQAS